MEKIKKIINKVCTKEIMFYVLFGVLTTVINLGTFFVLNSILNVDENISNFIAIFLAVIFAYFTNKDLVFHSQAQTWEDKIKEFIKFLAGRAFTMIIEFVGGLILFKTAMPYLLSKCFVTVIVVVLNFFISKFFAFRTKSKCID